MGRAAAVLPATEMLPDAFIVGMGYPVEGSLSTILHEVMHRRLRDFVPDRDPDGEEFIQQNFPVAIPALAGQAQPSGASCTRDWSR